MIRIFLILAMTMTACQADETISGYSDTDAVWQLTEINGQAPKSTVTLTFPEQGKIAGRAPCNRYFGTQTKPLPWFELAQSHPQKWPAHTWKKRRNISKHWNNPHWPRSAKRL